MSPKITKNKNQITRNKTVCHSVSISHSLFYGMDIHKKKCPKQTVTVCGARVTQKHASETSGFLMGHVASVERLVPFCCFPVTLFIDSIYSIYIYNSRIFTAQDCRNFHYLVKKIVDSQEIQTVDLLHNSVSYGCV